MTYKQIIIDGECLRCGAKTKKHILVCEKCTEEMGTVIAHKFTIDKQTREIKQLKKQLQRKEQECESWKALIDEAQIEQRKLEQQLEAYKMEADEGKEINAELKAENNLLRQTHKTEQEEDKKRIISYEH